jgi:predicted phage terminase large subunit-like protein
VGIDLSSALKERSDWTVMVLAGRIDDRIEFIDYRRMRVMGNNEKIEALCEMLLDWGIIEVDEEDGGRRKIWHATMASVQVMIEAISYQQSLKADAVGTLHQERGLYNLLLKAVTGLRGDKLTRLRGTFGMFQNGRIAWNEFINWQPFWNELLNYGHADHDDCPDAMWLAVKGLVGQGQVESAWDDWAADD